MLGKTWKRTLWLVFVGITLSTSVSGEGELPRLEQTEFDAHGLNETLLHISVLGRYSLQTQSDQGTKIEIVDRMAGPFAAAGSAGEQDGRLDLLLDKGTYKIRLRSHEEGVGTLKLAVHPFVEIDSSDKLLSLDAYQIESSSLEDLQQRSFWLHLKKRRILRLEAIGRNLKECRLWRDGVWLEDIKPRFSTYAPVNGQPMGYAEFYHDLNPGVYRLTFYGGAALAWTDDSGTHPFSLRMGYRRLGSSGVQIITLSPFGRDAYVAPAKTDFFQISRADKKTTRLSVRRWDDKASRHGGVERTSITKESRNPSAVVQTRETRRDKWVTVQGNPGDQVVLTYFTKKRETFSFSQKSGDYWISSLHSVEGRDAIDVTGVLTHPAQKTPVASQVFPVGLKTPLVTGKFNLLGETSLFLKLEEAGTYVIEEDETSGARGRYRIEPFTINRPRNYRPPPFESPGTKFELTHGFYKLTIQPDESKGILSFILRQKDAEADNIHAISPVARKQSLFLPKVTIPEYRGQYTLRLNHRHNVITGIIIRALPMDLSEPLPVILNPEQSVPVSISVRQRSTLVVERDKETPFLLNAGERRLTADSTLSPGSHKLTLKNTGTETTLFTLKTIPAEPPSELTLSDLKDQLEQPKSFPQLTEQKPLYVNFERDQKQHFTLIVEEPSLYRLETSGRLSTQLTVRTALITQLFTEKQNGIGRNALVQQYLRPGVYQVTVQTQGQSRGRAGIHLRRTSLRLEEGLTVGVVKKAHLQPDVALQYKLTIDKPGQYHLETLGLGKDFTYRLEDEEEWPLTVPKRGGEMHRHFEQGVYHYYSMPLPVASTRITALTRTPEKQERVGKGPHPIPFNETVKMMWREEGGRPPDIFTKEITAPVDVTIDLSGGMEGVIRLRGVESNGRAITGGSAWKGTLQPGQYEIAVKSAKENNLLPYTLRIGTSQLIPGLRQPVSLPADLTVRLGESGIVDLFSSGPTDVKASLWDETGTRLLAQNDDMPNDWNFRISQRLTAGRYLLKLVPVGRTHDIVHIYMKFREQHALPQRGSPPFTVDADLEEKVLAVPFRVDNTSSLVGVTVNASQLRTEHGVGALGVALLKGTHTLYEGTVNDTEAPPFYIPLQVETPYQILIWGLGDFTGEVTLDVASLEVKPVSVLPEQTELLWPPYAEPIALELTDADQSSYWARESTGAPLQFSSTLEQPFETTVMDAPLVMNAGRGRLILSPYEKTQHLILEPFALVPIHRNPRYAGQETVKTVELGQLPFAFNLENENDGPLLLEVNSIGGQIGAMTYTSESQLGSKFHWGGMGIVPSKTVAAVPSKGKYRAKIWQTRKTVETEKVHLTTHPLRIEERIQFGQVFSYEGPIKPGSAKTFALDKTHQTYELLLTGGLVAFVWDGKQTQALVAARGNTQELITVTSGELFIANRGNGAGLFRIERKREIAETTQEFDPKKGFEGVFTEAGTVSLWIEEIKGRKALFVAGDAVKSRLLGNDGIIREGERFQAQGILELSYEPGYVKVWEANPQEKDLAFMGKKPRRVKGLSNGLAKLENRSQRWMFNLKHPAYIIADADGPGVTGLLADQKVVATSVASSNKGRQLRYFLPPGDYQLWTRPLEGTTQAGNIRLLKVFPKPLDTASDSPRLIRPGEIQVFKFNVTVKGKVGVGIRTESDQLDAKLFDSQFKRLAASPVMIQELELGEYLLTIETVAQASGPIQYTPLVLGHTGGRLEIPEEVIGKYLTQTTEDE
jgi:hypothetical protein